MCPILRHCLCSFVILTMVSTSMGCTVVHFARGEKGTDLTSIQPGKTRADAEVILGPPLRSWTSPTGISYATYKYDAGVPPDMADASALAIYDLVSLGLFELFIKVPGDNALSHRAHITDRVVISYNDRDVILGIFNEFDELPPDGRSGHRRWEGAPTEIEK